MRNLSHLPFPVYAALRVLGHCVAILTLPVWAPPFFAVVAIAELASAADHWLSDLRNEHTRGRQEPNE